MEHVFVTKRFEDTDPNIEKVGALGSHVNADLMSLFGYCSAFKYDFRKAQGIVIGLVQLCSRSCFQFLIRQIGSRKTREFNFDSRTPTFPTIWKPRFEMGKTKGGFYAVARGRSVGIYNTWDECKAQVDGFGGARYKKFGSQAEAEGFINQNSGAGGASSSVQVHQPTGQQPIHQPRSFFPQMAGVKSSASNFLGPTALQARASGARSQVVSGQKRQFSTTQHLDTRRIPVTDERVVNKRAKLDGADNVGVDLKNFSVDSSGYVKVYTDGACSNNGFKGARAGIGVWFGDQHELNVSEPVQGRATNNTAEIQAAEKAIRQAKANGITKLNVNTDSQFVIKCVTQWMDKWQRNGWKLAGGKPVINRDDLEKLNAATVGMNVKWTYVPGHKGDYGNEAADRLAVEGAARF